MGKILSSRAAHWLSPGVMIAHASPVPAGLPGRRLPSQRRLSEDHLDEHAPGQEPLRQ
jgi:hypothetical protein